MTPHLQRPELRDAVLHVIKRVQENVQLAMPAVGAGELVAADGEITYDRVASVMDLCREAGAKNIGIVFDDLKPGPGAATAVGLSQ